MPGNLRGNLVQARGRLAAGVSYGSRGTLRFLNKRYAKEG
jgi:hypothetical protein